MSSNEDDINDSDDSEMSQESWDDMSVDIIESYSSSEDVSMEESSTNDSSSNSTSSDEFRSTVTINVLAGEFEEVVMPIHYSDEETVHSDRSTESENVQHDIHSDTPDIENEQQIASNERQPSQVTEHMASSSLDNAETVVNTSNDTSNVTDEAFSCPICLEGLTNMGPHRPACLKCGHIFGENCLTRWIKVGCKNDSKRCPSCNTKATLKDIRILYAKHLVAVDTSELNSLEYKLSQEIREKNLLKAEADRWKIKYECLATEINTLKSLMDSQKHVQSLSRHQISNRQCLKKINLGKTNAGCRVMAFSKSNMLLVVSQHSESPIFNSHIIRKVNALVLEPSKECIYAHKKQIRDMTFHPIENNLLASVGLDKFIHLSDIVSNMVVSSVEVEEPLWSCCWAGDNSNMLIAGSQFGSLYYVDRRFMKLLKMEGIRKPACVSLVPLYPSRSRKFINGGFLKTRMDVLSVFEHGVGNDIFEYKETALPLKGLWCSTSYDDQSNLILSSAKPCGVNKSIRHIVSKISDCIEEGPTIHPVVTFYGGDKATQLSRSCIVPSRQSQEDTLVSCYDEKSSQIKLFSVNSGSNIHNFPVKDKFLDLCHLDTNDNRKLVGLSENSLSIFAI